MAIYLQSDNLNGSVTDKNYQNTCRILHLDFGINSPAQMRVGVDTDRTSGKPNLSTLNFTKAIDSASNTLFEYACTGKVIDKVKFIITHVDKSTQPHAEYILHDVMVSHFATAASDQALPTEEISLSYSQLEVHYLANKNRPLRSGFNLPEAALI